MSSKSESDSSSSVDEKLYDPPALIIFLEIMQMNIHKYIFSFYFHIFLYAAWKIAMMHSYGCVVLEKCGIRSRKSFLISNF